MVETDWCLIVMAAITITTLLFCGRCIAKASRQSDRYKAERDEAREERDAAKKESRIWERRRNILKDGKY